MAERPMSETGDAKTTDGIRNGLLPRKRERDGERLLQKGLTGSKWVAPAVCTPTLGRIPLPCKQASPPAVRRIGLYRSNLPLEKNL